jgi:pilus assembly protein Flp/PilA
MMRKYSNGFLSMTVRFIEDETGQDLVEYALVVALIALGATASMSALATSFSTAFSNVGSHFSTYTS